MPVRVQYSGKKKIVTNDGSVQLDLNSNRLLHYDQSKYRFIIGTRTPSSTSTDTDNKVLMSKEGENVLNV